MKNLLILCVIFISCETNVAEKETDMVVSGRTFSIITYEDCEYLVSGLNSDLAVMTHKGNCKNPIHFCK